MQTVLKIVGGLIALVVLVVLIAVTWAGTQDGPPAAFLRGGPFTTGTLYTGPEPDWSPMRTRGEVEFQTLVNDKSRITWIAEHENKIYILSGYMNTAFGKLWKHPAFIALEDMGLGRFVEAKDLKLGEAHLQSLRSAAGTSLGSPAGTPLQPCPDAPAAQSGGSCACGPGCSPGR